MAWWGAGGFGTSCIYVWVPALRCAALGCLISLGLLWFFNWIRSPLGNFQPSIFPNTSVEGHPFPLSAVLAIFHSFDIWYLLSFIYKYFIISIIISSLTHELEAKNSQCIVFPKLLIYPRPQRIFFQLIFPLLISSLIVLRRENVVCMILIPWNLPRGSL